MTVASLIIILILLVILSFVWPPDSPWSPWWRTSRKVARKACRLAEVSKDDVVYELGSGDGEFILTAGREFHAKKAIGIEIDHSRYFISRFKHIFRNAENVEFVRRDFKKVKLTDATVVYFYLVPRVIDRILPKLKKELSPGTKVLSYKYKMPLKESKKSGDIYLYKF